MEQSPTNHFEQALAKFHHRDVKGGLIDLEKAINLDPFRWEYYWTKGSFNYRRRAYKLAESDLTEAINLCPDVKQVTKVYRKRMFCYGHLKFYDKLVHDSTWLIEHGFSKKTAYLWRGWGNYKKGDIDYAIDDYSHAVDLLPDYPLVRVDRATLYYRSKRYNEALDDFNSILGEMSLDPSIAAFLYQYRALTFYHLGNIEKSLEDYNHNQQILGLKPFSSVQSYLDSIKKNIEYYFSDPNMPSLPLEKYL